MSDRSMSNIARRALEKVAYFLPLGGFRRADNRAEAVLVSANRLGVQFAYLPGGLSKTIAAGVGGANTVIPQGSGKILRILTDGADIFLRVDPGAPVAADPTIADNVTIWLPAGETNFIELEDPDSNDYYVSVITAAGSGTTYVSVVQ